MYLVELSLVALQLERGIRPLPLDGTIEVVPLQNILILNWLPFYKLEFFLHLDLDFFKHLLESVLALND